MKTNRETTKKRLIMKEVKERYSMSLIGDDAPAFEAVATQGKITVPIDVGTCKKHINIL
ncbi:MAG: hypothetical protein KAT14_02550 [Candidatus Marinimicrobia bacterium]|nr:hypothetical protein [Candidatus Neomarinimicrobiota bacterium]